MMCIYKACPGGGRRGVGGSDEAGDARLLSLILPSRSNRPDFTVNATLLHPISLLILITIQPIAIHLLVNCILVLPTTASLFWPFSAIRAAH